MSRQFLIDGYNLLRQMPSLEQATLEASRRKLVLFLSARRKSAGAASQMTVVFDGQTGHWSPATGGDIAVVFSAGETADDLIMRTIEDAHKPGEIILVTDDRDLGFYCRTHGAQWWHVKDFLSRVQTSRQGQSGKSSGTSGLSRTKKTSQSDKVISGPLAVRVNRELSRLWLDQE